MPGFFPHPLSSLLNCVIIFKQINSIAEFSCPNDEFAAQMPLISHSPENQLMNSTGLSLERHLEQLCTAPCAAPSPHPPHCPPSPPTPHVTAACSGAGAVYKGRPSVPAKGRMSSQGARAPCAGETIIVEIFIDFGQRQEEHNLQSREVVRCDLCLPYKFRAQS